MKIESVKVSAVDILDEDLFAGPPARKPTTRHVTVVSLRTDQGTTGLGIAFVYRGMARAVTIVAEELAELLIGESPAAIGHIHARLNAYAQTLDEGGIFLSALSAIDCALWDLKGKHAGLPLWRLLGGARNRIPIYASGALHRDLSDAELAEEAARLAADGFRYIKVHLGLGPDSNMNRELARARIAREAVGPDVDLMCDINEKWPVGDAVTIGTRLAQDGMFCIEDPTHHHDYLGLARITDSVPTRIMAGENWWGIWSFEQAFRHRAVDIAMIDVMHVGGITNWMKVAAMAEACKLPVVSHIMTEFQAHLVAAAPNGFMSEYKEWNWRLFEGCPEREGGELILSERPGHGLSLSPEFAGLA